MPHTDHASAPCKFMLSEIELINKNAKSAPFDALSFDDDASYKGQPFTGVASRKDKSSRTVKKIAGFFVGYKHGPWKEWYASGQQKIVCYYFNDRLHGPFLEWHHNGQLKSHACYMFGQVVAQKKWDENGVLEDFEVLETLPFSSSQRPVMNHIIEVESENTFMLKPVPAEMTLQQQAEETEDHYLYKGINASSAQDYNGALDWFNQGIQQKPSALLYYHRASALKLLSMFEEAMASYTEALKVDNNMASAYFSRAKLRHEQFQETEEALKDIERALKINRHYLAALYYRGSMYFNLQEWAKAVNDYTTIVSFAPEEYSAYHYRGNTKSRTGDDTGAEADYTTAIDIYPYDAGAYSDRGVVRRRMKNLEGALDDYNKAIEINANDHLAIYNRGNLKSQLGDKQGAITDYTKVIEIAPEYENAFYNRARRYVDIGEYTKAIDDYSSAIALNPQGIDAYEQRAATYFKLKEFSKAIEDYTMSISLAPKDTYGYLQRGRIKFYNLNDVSGGLEDYLQTVVLDPSFTSGYMHAGWLCLKTNQYKKALPYLTRAVELSPSNPNHYINLTLCHYLLNDKKSALKVAKGGMEACNKHAQPVLAHKIILLGLLDDSEAMKIVKGLSKQKDEKTLSHVVEDFELIAQSDGCPAAVKEILSRLKK